MPVDPYIARGGIPLDVTDTLMRGRALQQRDRALDQDQQFIDYRQQQTQNALLEQQDDDAEWDQAYAAKDWNRMAALDPQATKVLWDMEQARQPQAPLTPPEVRQDAGYSYMFDPSKGVIPGSVQAPQRAPLQSGGAVQSAMPEPGEDPRVTAARERARATAEGRVQGQAAAEAAVDLPRVEGNATNMIDVLDQLEKSPGFKYLWGAYALTPGGAVPGTPQADAFAIWEQVQGKAFLEAFSTLKGGGQITEKEGEKATAAITRLSQRKQSEAGARAAINDLRSVIKAGLARAEAKARSQNAAPEAAPTRRRFNPETGKIE